MSALQYISFYVNDVLYGLDILQVGEVLHHVEHSAVPGAHANVLGLMNLRGAIVSVIDLSRSLGHSQRLADRRATCIILKTDAQLSAQQAEVHRIEQVGDDSVGLLVDRMGEVFLIEEKDIDPSPANTTEAEARFIKGVVKLEAELLTVLSLEKVLGFC